MKNELKMTISADIANDAFVRSSVAAFCLPLEPSIDGLEDIKTVVSEAFTNSVVHGYDGDKSKFVEVCVSLEDGKLEIIVKDDGCGIADVEKAIQPFFTTKPEQERSGMGFALMSAFMDDMKVVSAVGEGTRVVMTKRISEGKDA